MRGGPQEGRWISAKVEISMKNPKAAPEHLGPDTQAWWLACHADFDLAPHHTMLVTLAAEAWDRTRQAREILAESGIVVGGREAGVRPHPAIAIERDSRIAFARLLAQLNLDAEPPAIDASMTAAVRSTRPGG
jgi:phage terminase small subunit